ncbi:MAG: hypothetical protein ACK5LK_02325 [Chthoniobacterales bacterium]
MRLVIFYLFLSFASSFAAKEEFISPGPSPPIAKNIEITVYVGETVDIPLQALGRAADQSKFLLRSYPKFGNLGEIIPAKPGHATINYEHRKGGAVGITDSFTYAVQSHDSPVSAPGKVLIRIIERPPVFEIPKVVDFGEVISGRSKKKIFTISNQGGGVISGQIKVFPPWYLTAPPYYHLGAGQKQQIEVEIRPEETGDFSEHIFFSHDEKILLPVTAKAVAPFHLETGKIFLSHPLSQNSEKENSSETKSQTTLKVTNNLAETLRLKLNVPTFILAENKFDIPAKKTIFIPLHAQFSALKGGDGLITLEADDYSRTIPVTLYHAPEAYTVVPSQGVDFGTLLAGESRSATIRLSNIGGSVISFDLKFPDEIQVVGGNRLTLDVGESGEKNISFISQKTGTFLDKLEIVTEKSSKSIPITAEILSKAGERDPLPLTKITTDGIQQPLPTDEVKNNLTLARPTGPQIPIAASFDKLQILSRSETAIRIAWKDSGESDVSYQVLAREIGLNENGRVTQTWKILPNVFINRQDDYWMADITGLHVGQALNIRINTLGEDGKPISLSPPFNISSLSPPPRTPFPTNWFLAIVLVVVAIVWIKYHRKKRHEMDRIEFDKITKQ